MNKEGQVTGRYLTVIVGTAVMLALAVPAYTQSANRSGPPDTATTRQAAPKTSMSMDNMMKQCREHCSAATKQMDDMMKKMSDARASNDSAKMRGALEDAQKPLTDMRNHMDQCMSMMNMMQSMMKK